MRIPSGPDPDRTGWDYLLRDSLLASVAANGAADPRSELVSMAAAEGGCCGRDERADQHREEKIVGRPRGRRSRLIGCFTRFGRRRLYLTEHVIHALLRSV